jgi:hypothetical protein
VSVYTEGMERLQRVLDAPVKAPAPTEHHLLLKARTLVDTDQGDFEAVISSEWTDREMDVVLAPAMVTALNAWTKVNKLIPLLWSDRPAPEDVVGHIEPESAKAVNGQVVVSGWIDQSPNAARKLGGSSRAACWASRSATWSSTRRSARTECA